MVVVGVVEEVVVAATVFTRHGRTELAVARHTTLWAAKIKHLDSRAAAIADECAGVLVLHCMHVHWSTNCTQSR